MKSRRLVLGLLILIVLLLIPGAAIGRTGSRRTSVETSAAGAAALPERPALTHPGEPVDCRASESGSASAPRQGDPARQQT